MAAFVHGALPEIVAHEETGMLLPPGDEKALAKAILVLLADPERRRAMGQAGRERVEERFDIRRLTRKIETVYKTLRWG